MRPAPGEDASLGLLMGHFSSVMPD
ncbi:hypothetical protein AGR5A_Cc110024 [Agrobacterium genomosp. 5 str. CFBP 6626]|nr:hypothetical protein AGR5A_Cc110024 [Agrobacterium genomosp. 5 str. CFBP 6626]